MLVRPPFAPGALEDRLANMLPSVSTQTKLTPVVLCGGSGTRLWPLSRKLLPKQFLALTGRNTMLQETVLRAAGLPDIEDPVIVSHADHRFLVAEQMREAGVLPGLLLLEPRARNTAAAITAAALCISRADPDAVLLVLPSDHAVGDVRRFREAVTLASRLAQRDRLVAFGAKPRWAATGYGYIRRGAPDTEVRHAYEIAEFVEKPDSTRAARYIADGSYYWNSGMFVFKASRFLDEVKRLCPDILEAMQDAVTNSERDLDFLRLQGSAFDRSPSVSVDIAVMERTRLGSVVASDFAWSDVGSWASVWDLDRKDEHGNAVRGDVHLDGTGNCYVRAEERLVVALGVRDLLIVETEDAVLVTNRENAERVRRTVEHLERAQRKEHMTRRRVYRPWGYFESIGEGTAYQVKRLMVKPGGRLSLQRHARRAEHWVVVSGQATITRGGDEVVLGPNQSTFIPVGEKHRLSNSGGEPLFVIEVQSGDYFGEDDIERLDDDYHRR
jgi:mannose-1-phosphate guanylyltransferase/mannose-6-phosphate isomerase